MTIENLKAITRFIKLQEIANMSKLKYSSLYTKMMRGTELNVKESDTLTHVINKIMEDVAKNVK